MQRFTAAWVLPVDGAPIANGAVLVGDDGRILEVGPTGIVAAPPVARVHDLGLAILMPGLVNTHSHLELTGFAGQVEAGDFREWIRQVIAIKAKRSEEQFFDAACEGIRAGWHAGVTTVCDTGSTGSVLAALHHLGASGIAHHEVFGAHPAECEPAIRRFAADLDRLAHHATGRAALGVSPHAPYTVSGELYAASASLARAHGVPMAVHVAEPPAESSLLADFTGIFAEDWQRRGIPRPTNEAISPVGWLERHGVLSPRTLCVHAIHVAPADADLMLRHGSAVAHCPRSNRFHHHADAPVHLYLERGLRLGLGTDSEISVAPPDLLAEARAARVLTGWTAGECIHALTLGGAAALERDRDSGSLTPGKWADMVAFEIDAAADPEEAVLASGAGDVLGTWLTGREVYRAGPR